MAPLTPGDEDYLNERFPERWEVYAEGGSHRLVIHDYPLPDRYEPTEVCLMLVIPPSYPVAGLDMFYLNPAVKRKGGGDIKALSNEAHLGKEWQRWSRHYEWRPGDDCVATHFHRIENTLLNEP